MIARLETLDELLAHNAALLERHTRLRTYQLFADGTFEDEGKRHSLFRCVQVIANHFQTMLYARQSHCDDPSYRGLFLRHLREEAGHDEVATAERGSTAELWDPILESAAAWFILRMTILDNVEKLAVMHLVVEAGAAHMSSVCAPAMRRFAGARYFELHADADPRHVTMALEPLAGQSPATLARLRTVIDQAWRVLDTWIGRVATLVLGGDGARR
jgi:hypothetical protein